MNMALKTYLITFIAAACASVVLSQAALAAITPMPTTLTVSRGQAASRSVTYRLQGLDIASDTITSPGGQFYVGVDLVGSNSQMLTAHMVHNNAVVTEALSIPASVIEAALARHSNTITYQREFAGGLFPAEGVEVSIIVMSEAASDFEIKRMDLYFANRRPEITVGLNEKDLRAYIDIRYAGTGLLQAFWEVDGRVLATVNQHMTFAGNATLESPSIPALPTFEPGSHVVRFVITNPSPELTVPSIVYFVLPKRSGALGMDLLSPADAEAIEKLPQTFRWAGTALADIYLIRYYEDPEAEPVFSAYTKKTTYSLPSGLPEGSMPKGKRYYWSVTALDSEGGTVGQSTVRSFMLK